MSKYIPPKTLAKLNNPPPPGARHSWMITVGIPLIGNGWSKGEVFELFRAKFPAAGANAVPNSEIHHILEGIIKYEPEPSLHRSGTDVSALAIVERAESSAVSTRTPSPTETVKHFLNGFSITEAELLRHSPESRVWKPAFHDKRERFYRHF